MNRVHNFGAGPAGLPLPALVQAQAEFLDFEGTGMSIMEHSHRGKAYEKVHNEAISLLRELIGIPDTYDVAFVQGGASAQFAMVPMNFLPQGKSADYVVTGTWSERAIAEAQIVGKARVAATTVKDKKYTRVPTQAELSLDTNAAYVHYTTNNTIFGTQFHAVPNVGAVPLIADMSSDFMWKPFDISPFTFVYAGAQKNIGPAGIAVVIGKKDFIASARKDIPIIFRYATHTENNSLYNTPPTFSIYLIRNVLAHVKATGGLAAMEKKNRDKASLLYGTIDELSSFYVAPVENASRSTMNIVFRLPTEDLEKKFVSEAQAKKMIGLAGHRSAGGIRVSAYNAVELESIEVLTDFMRGFAKANA